MSATEEPDEVERQRHARTLEVFIEALPLSGHEREAHLAEACEDETMHAEVRSLLERDQAARSEDRVGGAGRDLLAAMRDEGGRSSAADADLAAGARIGPYRLLEKIGEGGFGSVYVAEQSDPVRRKVALKVIKAGMDTKEVIARFEAERNALSLMNHSSIARVYDAGVTPSSRPYFVMEYVEGIPIHEFCDVEELSLPDRLKLFIDVCGAVQHAHQKGIIHRDLKPSNILVTMQDGRALPKVIDFGIAKATAGSLSENTVFTHLGQLMGTPEYMSPEQAEMSGVGVDSTTDIYALGVVLYKLLTGALPFEPATLRAKGLAEVHRILREEEPSKPSTRVSSMGAEATTSIGRKRRTDARTLRRDLSGDLDWIVMRAMEKQRTRRYSSASELAADVQRHLDDEPVLAGPPSAAYRMRKFARRNRAGVAFGAATGLLLLAGTVGTSWGMLRAADERDDAVAARGEAEAASELAARHLAEANDARREAETARALAEERREQADDEGRRARAVTRFLLDTLGLANPDITQLANMDIRQVLAEAEAKVGSDFADYPTQEAEIRTVVGRAYLTLGRPDLSVENLRRALELRKAEDPVDPLALYDVMSDLLSAERRHGLWDWVLTAHQLSAVANTVYAMRMPELSDALIAFIANAQDEKVGYEQLEADFDALVARGKQLYAPDDERWDYLTRALFGGAWTLGWFDRAGKAPVAPELILRALKLRRELGIASSEDVRRYTTSAIEFYLRSERFPEAHALAEEQMERLGALLQDPDHWYLAIYKTTLGICELAEGHHLQAEALLLEAAAVFEGSVGASVLEATYTREALARLYETTGRPQDASADREAAIRAYYDAGNGLLNPIVLDRLLSAEHAPLVELGERFQRILAEASAAHEPLAARRAELAALVEELLTVRARVGIADEDPLAVLIVGGWGLRAQMLGFAGLHDLAELILEDALTVVRAHPDSWGAQILLAAVLAGSRNARGSYAEAEAAAREGLRALEDSSGKLARESVLDSNAASLRTEMGLALMSQGELAEAEEELRAAVAAFTELSLPRTPIALEARTCLAEVLQLRGRASESTALLGALFDEVLEAGGVQAVNLNALAWYVARVSDRDPASYSRAVTLAESAVAVEPENLMFLNTLGVALYRAGRFAEALEHLIECDRLRRTSPTSTPAEPADWAFIALAHRALGNVEQAQEALAAARESMQLAAFADSAENRALLAEAEALID